eukprot:snap_masked-scaffold_18-processed-gene-5.40-mRNA-1 protein AED:1.00 eAED:1.00 QI:0/0/0/0/1/1/2/0/88
MRGKVMDHIRTVVLQKAVQPENMEHIYSCIYQASIQCDETTRISIGLTLEVQRTTYLRSKLAIKGHTTKIFKSHYVRSVLNQVSVPSI